jgi:uncharacterized spore protein YtfJ
MPDGLNPTTASASPEALREFARIPERARADASFGKPEAAADRTVIPVAEVMYGFGMGWGSGTNEQDGVNSVGGGGGGGGGSRVRGVAVIEVAPDGVRVHPVVDVTAVALAGITFAAAATAITARTILKLFRG